MVPTKRLEHQDMTYEYHCPVCELTFEVEQKITEDPLKECPHCGAANPKRLVSGGTGFQLVGSGWAADNYSSSGPNKSSE